MAKDDVSDQELLDTSSSTSIDDDIELRMSGYKSQMPRQFTTFSLISLSFALSTPWSGIGSSMGISLTDASSAGTIWAMPVAALGSVILSTGMCELASAYPVAGAQYYWSFMVSDERYRAFAAFINGWLSLLGWWFSFASVLNFVSSMILAIISLWYPYSPQHWQQWLVYVGLVWLAVSINVLGSQFLPLWNQFIMCTSCISVVATTITLFVCSRGHFPPASQIFGDSTTSTGWPSDGFGFVLAISNAVYSFTATDCGAHLCEEIHNPGKNVPKVILYPIGIGFITAWPFAIACMTAITDVKAVLETRSGLPLMEIYLQATGSRVAATILMVLFAICFFGCAVANGTTSSRTLWAICRDGALPYSDIWMQISPRHKMPVNAMCLSATVVSLYGLIFVASTTAFSSMISVSNIFLQTSCIVPQAILLYRGRSKVLPPRYFALGKYSGPLINITAILWVIFLDIVYFMPFVRPITPTNMNYASVVAVGLMTFIFGLWFFVKKETFKGPNVNINELMRIRDPALFERAPLLHSDCY